MSGGAGGGTETAFGGAPVTSIFPFRLGTAGWDCLRNGQGWCVPGGSSSGAAYMAVPWVVSGIHWMGLKAAPSSVTPGISLVVLVKCFSGVDVALQEGGKVHRQRCGLLQAPVLGTTS